VTNRKLQIISALRATLMGVMVLPSLTACTSSGEEATAQGLGADTVVQAILGSVASADQDPNLSPRRSPQEQEVIRLNVDLMGYNRGDPQAPVRVMEISDFGCGYCRRFHEETWPTLREVYVEAGLVQWKFVPFVLGMFPNGLEASMAGECGGEQDEFFAMQSRLFGDQAGWKNSADPFPFFAELAEEEGLDVERYNGCIEGGWRENAVRNNIRLGRELGVRGTPTFLIDGIPISGALPLSAFRDILDVALMEKGVTPPERG
jgi:protein-disulfide isomerase